MRRHYRGSGGGGRQHRRRAPPPPPQESSSDDDDEDAFAAISRKKKAKTVSEPPPPPSSSLKPAAPPPEKPPQAADSMQQQQQAAKSSSTKRHHGAMSQHRKQRMDALLQELEMEKGKINTSTTAHFEPDKKGSFVEPGKEHLTTNVFVGNLAPSITEEELTELFRQFGDLQSVKIMWPRNPEERSRNRHTGFVCFQHRRDAQDCIDACNESDPFQVGRRLKLGWASMRRGGGGGGGSHPAIITQRRAQGSTPNMLLPAAVAATTAASTTIDTTTTSSSAATDGITIYVVTPKDKRRANLIATVASFVAKDGAQLERKIQQREAGNPAFAFLRPGNNQEHIYYKWRVYAFLQGDSFFTWRTEPFVMIDDVVCWMPPPLDAEASRAEREAAAAQQVEISRQKQQRRFLHAKRDYMTGRQLEQVKKNETTRLDPHELDILKRLLIKELCASRTAICNAMAFCFEHAAAAKQISSILKSLLVDQAKDEADASAQPPLLSDAAAVSVETRIARLFLLSDILFNSQQPGVKNAFAYRHAIEEMAPLVFFTLGKSCSLGRLTRSKLTSAVDAVLAAWTRWGVYNPTFLKELQARFQGKEIVPEDEEARETPTTEEEDEKKKKEEEEKINSAATIRLVSQGQWSSVDATNTARVPPKTETEIAATPVNPDPTNGRQDEDDPDGEPLDHVDGEPLDEDVDGLPLEEGDLLDEDDAVDGEPLDDGEPMEDEGADGEPIDDDGEAALL